MKAHLKHSESSSVMILALILTSVLLIIAGSGIGLLSSEYKISSRSAHWNQALFVAEAGVDEAWNQANVAQTNSSAAWSGWSGAASNRTKTVSLTPTGTNTTVVGTASVVVEESAGSFGTNYLITSTGVTTVPNSNATNITRVVELWLAPFPAYKFGMLGKGNIDFNGNNVYIDSFDSTDPTKSTGGEYDAAKKQNNGDVGTNGVEIDAGGADVYGSLYVGVEGSITNAPGFYQPPGETKEIGRQIDIPDPVLDWTPPGSASSISGSTTITTGDYTISSISLGGSSTLTLDATGGPIRLYVTGDIATSGNGSIVVSGTYPVEVWFVGNVSLSGNGLVVPTGYTADKMSWYGLPPPDGVTKTISDVGNGSFTGTIYAPGHDMTIAGNGVVYGSIIAKTITMDGNATFHYDESLDTTTAPLGYQTLMWRELSP